MAIDESPKVINLNAQGTVVGGDDGDDQDIPCVDAAEIADSPHATQTRLSRRWFTEGQSTLVRLVTSQLLPVSIHAFVPSGRGKLTLACNGSGCALCLARHRPTPRYLAAMLFVEQCEIGVVELDQQGGAESLRGQILPLFKRPDFHRLVIEVSLERKRFCVTVVRTLDATEPDADGDDYGTAAIRDLIARGGLRKKAILAAIERRDNQQLLSDLDWLAPKIRLYHQGIDISAL